MSYNNLCLNLGTSLVLVLLDIICLDLAGVPATSAET